MEPEDRIRQERAHEAGRMLARLRDAIRPALDRYPVDAAYVFGSVARGTVTPFSDVDVALLLSEDLLPYDRLKLELAIQAELEDASGLAPVDVRTLNAAPLLVQGRVVQDGTLVYDRGRDRRVAFEVAVRKRYFDFAPVAHRLHMAFLRHVKREGLLHGRSRHPQRDTD